MLQEQYRLLSNRNGQRINWETSPHQAVTLGECLELVWKKRSVVPETPVLILRDNTAQEIWFASAISTKPCEASKHACLLSSFK
ncbi:hypothetical protein TNCT_252621 [Trichonephila clavata]|uniref:Uncharacterized protein n=1 Tax=Trichonephila clavata TaxID=2740835 RepID=A0A8X6LUM4_TRICU|nr:hypothetical protein TNCT_252621 [Trichonephila clavata]